MTFKGPSAPRGRVQTVPDSGRGPDICGRVKKMDPDIRTRDALEEHWRASERGDIESEHAIYAEDAILDYPQSGERFRGRATTTDPERGLDSAARTDLLGSNRV
jgi:hypothetical protein